MKKKACIFCTERSAVVDYKDANLLRRFMSERAKIRARRVTGNCAQHQRAIATAIKTARELALIPYQQRQVADRGRGRGRRDEGDGERPGGRSDRSDSRTLAAPEEYDAPDSTLASLSGDDATDVMDTAVAEETFADAEGTAGVEAANDEAAEAAEELE